MVICNVCLHHNSDIDNSFSYQEHKEKYKSDNLGWKTI